MEGGGRGACPLHGDSSERPSRPPPIFIPLFLHAASKGLVEHDKVLLAGDANGDEVKLRTVHRTLGIEHGQIAVDALVVALPGQAVRLGSRMNKRFLRLKLSGKGYAVDQRVGHFPERGLNGLLIIRHSYLLVGFGNTQVGDVPPALEDRQADLRQEGPDARAAVKEVGQLVRGRADVRGQRNAGEEIRPRRADVRVAFRLYRVPALLPQISHTENCFPPSAF